MSKEFPQFSEDESAKTEAAAAKPKRPAGTRVRKTASTSKSMKSDEPKPGAAEIVKAPVAEAKVAVVEKEAPSKAEPEWAEVAPESVGGATSAGEGGGKRKRRRRKGKGGGSSVPGEGAETPVPTPTSAPAASAPQSVKSRMNSELLAKSAWKIYLAEVSEEGVALVGDQDARELARRCFRLAEIFLEEQGRRTGAL